MIKLFEMFAGYGGASFGLAKANIEFECVGISEIDKYAIECYNKNFPNVKNFGDCSKINPNDLPNFDLLTGGFPCQDVSIAGNRDLLKGRTNLYKETIRIAEAKKPKYLLLENVKGLLSMEVEEQKLVNIIVRDLQKIGYGVCWKVLNSKDYGIPQNRERIWFVCKLGGWNFMEFQFPYPKPLKIFLKDILEKEVDKKYYLSKKMIASIIRREGKDVPQPNLIGLEDKEIGVTITTKAGGRYQDNFVINQKTRDVGKAIEVAQTIANENNKPVQLDLYHLQSGELRPLTTYIPQDLDVHRCLQSGEPKEVLIEPYLIQKHHSEKLREYKEGVCPTIGSDMGGDSIKVVEPIIMGGTQEHQTPRIDGIVPSLTSAMGMGGGQTPIINSIRKLTPKECFRLMGFLNDEITLEGLSDTQCYRLAGNGWCLHPVIEILKGMFI